MHGWLAGGIKKMDEIGATGINPKERGDMCIRCVQYAAGRPPCCQGSSPYCGRLSHGASRCMGKHWFCFSGQGL